MNLIHDLISNVDHIQFNSLDVALEFRKANGGHLFVSKGAKCVVWFSSGWTATPILTAPVLRGIDGVLNPLPHEIDSLRGLVNPYQIGSVAHNHFSVFYERAMRQSDDSLYMRFLTLMAESKNFLNRSSSQMAEAEFEADVIAKVYRYRFERPIQEHKGSGLPAAGNEL